jgi:putative transposase
MPMKRDKPEQIVTLLRQIEVEIANGKTTPHGCKEAHITVQTYYRWRKEFGGPKLDQAKRMKDLERENAKLKRLVAGAVLGKADFEGCCGGKLLSPERRRGAVGHARRKYGVSERQACRLLKQGRGYTT